MMDKDQFEATKQGVKDAILEIMQGATAMPGADILDSIEKGVKAAFLEWLKNK